MITLFEEFQRQYNAMMEWQGVSYSRDISKCLSNTHFFDFDFRLANQEFHDLACIALENSLFRLPYQQCFFEFDLPIHDGTELRHVRVGANLIEISSVGIEDCGGNYVLNVTFVTYGAPRLLGGQFSFEPETEEKYFFAPGITTPDPDDLQEFVNDLIHRCLALCMSLESRDVVTIANTVSPRNQRRRIEKGLPPLIEHKTVRINPKRIREIGAPMGEKKWSAASLAQRARPNTANRIKDFSKAASGWLG